MATKKASLRGKGASIFFGDDNDDEIESEEVANSQTVEPAPQPLPQIAESPRVAELQSRRVAEPETIVRPSPRPVSRVAESERRELSQSTTFRLPQSNPPLSRPLADTRPNPSRANSQSSTVSNSPAGRATSYTRVEQPPRGVSIADETRAEYIVERDDSEDYLRAGQGSFSEFYITGESHYLRLEPLATRLTSEQMDRLSSLERRIHQGRRRKEPRITKNSIIRALLEATFDLDLDTNGINSEIELVNRFREALHLASLVSEVRD